MPSSELVKQDDGNGRSPKRANSKSMGTVGWEPLPANRARVLSGTITHDSVIYGFHIHWERSKSPFLNSHDYTGEGFHWVFMCRKAHLPPMGCAQVPLTTAFIPTSYTISLYISYFGLSVGKEQLASDHLSSLSSLKTGHRLLCRAPDLLWTSELSYTPLKNRSIYCGSSIQVSSFVLGVWGWVNCVFSSWPGESKGAAFRPDVDHEVLDVKPDAVAWGV